MRVWFLKFAGFLLWGAFLFVPFIARAENGFDITLPLESVLGAEKEKGDVLLSLGGFDLSLDEKRGLKMPVSDKWDIKFKASKDSVLSNDFNAKIRQDRIPLDDGHRESFVFGIKLHYTLN